LDLAVEMRRTAVLHVLELFIGSDPRYTDIVEEFGRLMKSVSQ
jgi:hypothetical protein